MQTTENLRSTLFEVVDNLVAGKMDVQEAAVICKAADQIIKSAALEIKYAETQARLEMMDTSTSIEKVVLLSDMR